MLGVQVRRMMRVDAGRADLKEGYWNLSDAWVTRLGQEPEKFETYLISTYLTPDRVRDALGTVFSVSFWITMEPSCQTSPQKLGLVRPQSS